jgi:ABC-type lipoprotein export system ATPase subunit
LFHIYREGELETVALRGVQLQLDFGEWVSVVGPSGSGKSTLLLVLAGLLEPSGGFVMIDGRDVTRLDEAARAQMRRSKIGVIMQRDNLHPALSVAENVALPLELASWPRAQVTSRVDGLLGRVDLVERRTNRPHQLSGGEAQRAAIAVALAPEPEVLIADELTGELDAATTESMLDLLETVRRDENVAILTVTHNDLVAARADRRFELHDGVLTDAA